MPRLWINVTTEDGELLERIEANDEDFTTAAAKFALVDEIESALRTVRAREANPPCQPHTVAGYRKVTR